MRFCLGLALLVSAACVFAQTSVNSPDGDEPEVARAKASLEKLRALVEAGALPRIQMEKAEAAIDDARDAAFLRKTLYGQDLTAGQSDEMIAAAARRFERRKQAFDDAKKLVEAAVEPQVSLATFLEELELANRTCILAEERARLALQLAEMARAEEAREARLFTEPATAPGFAERFDGDGVFTATTLTRVETAFAGQFGKPLPVSALGDTAVHRALGFDHTGRVDVAVNPDQPEGLWLREFLTRNRIPYFAFRQAVPGKATGAHIHLGPMSTRFKPGE